MRPLLVAYGNNSYVREQEGLVRKKLKQELVRDQEEVICGKEAAADVRGLWIHPSGNVVTKKVRILDDYTLNPLLIGRNDCL